MSESAVTRENAKLAARGRRRRLCSVVSMGSGQEEELYEEEECRPILESALLDICSDMSEPDLPALCF